MTNLRPKRLQFFRLGGAALLLLPALCLAGTAEKAAKKATSAAESVDLNKGYASCMESKARFDKAYEKVKEEADKKEEGCQSAMQTKADNTCRTTQEKESKLEPSCCVRTHKMVSFDIQHIGTMLQKACDDLMKADEAAALCQQDDNNQQCALKARAPHLKSAANNLKLMRKAIENSRKTQDQVKGLSSYALTQMLDRVYEVNTNREADDDRVLKTDKLCSHDADLFQQPGNRTLADAFNLGEFIKCGPDGSIVSRDESKIKSRMEEIRKYRDSLAPLANGTTADVSEDFPKTSKFGPYVAEEANSVWIAQSAGQVTKSIEPTAESLAKAVEYQAQAAESASQNLGSLPNDTGISGGKPSSDLASNTGQGGNGGDRSGASASRSYVTPGGGPPDHLPSPATEARQQIPANAGLFPASAFGGDLFASAAPSAPRATKAAPGAAQNEDNPPLWGKSENQERAAEPFEYKVSKDDSAITSSGRKDTLPAEKAGGKTLSAENSKEEATRLALRTQKAEISAPSAELDRSSSLAEGKEPEPPPPFAKNAGRIPASNEESAATAVAEAGKLAEEEAAEQPWPEDTASPDGQRMLKELGNSERLRDLLRKRLAEKGDPPSEAEEKNRRAMARYLAKAEELAASGQGVEDQDGSGSLPRLLSQLQSGRSDESLFLRVRSAHLRFQQRSARR